MAQPTPAAIIDRAQPGDVILFAAPSIKDPDVAQALARAAYSGVFVWMVLDEHGALDPEAYTRHLSTVPGITIRLIPRQRHALMVFKGLVFSGDGIWLPGGTVRTSSERTEAAWFARLFQRARPYVYVPPAPPGYRIVETDPALEALKKAEEAFQRAFEEMYGGPSQ